MTSVSLRRISIRNRLFFLTAVILLLLSVPFAVTIQDYQQDLMIAKQTKTQHLTENAYALLEYYTQQEKLGSLTTEQAQQAAKQAIAALRYGDNDYFWINDSTPSMVMHPLKPELDGKNLSDFKDP